MFLVKSTKTIQTIKKIAIVENIMEYPKCSW